MSLDLSSQIPWLPKDWHLLALPKRRVDSGQQICILGSTKKENTTSALPWQTLSEICATTSAHFIGQNDSYAAPKELHGKLGNAFIYTSPE